MAEKGISHNGYRPNIVKNFLSSSLGGLVTHRTLTKCGRKRLPLIGGFCHTADTDQMWSKYCPSSEDFVTQRTLTKCGREFLSHVKDFVTQRTPTKCGPNIAPRWRTLSHSGLRPNVVQILPLVRGLCHTADFNQMWSKSTV
jgi:hypothetical protein